MKRKLGWFSLIIVLFVLQISMIGVLIFAYGKMEKLDNAQTNLQELLHSLSVVNISIQSLLIDEYIENRYEEWQDSRVSFEEKFIKLSQLPTIIDIKSTHVDFAEMEQTIYALWEINKEDAKLIENDLLVLFESGNLEEFDTLQSFKSRTGTKITLLIENIRSFQVVRTTMEAIFLELTNILNIELKDKKQNIQYLGIISSLLLLVAIFMIALSRSLTFIKEKELVDLQNNELQRLNKIKDSFLTNTSHELRTPLGGIIGLSETLSEGIGGPVTPAQKGDLKMITQAGKRLSYLINDILDFSKMKNQDIEIVFLAVDMYSIADIVLKLSKPLIKSKNVTFNNKINPEFSTVMADENRVQQILYNLVGNAIKFTESGNIEISAKDIGNTLEISVKDTGIGISEENLDSVFESFEQIDSSTERLYGGTGLGLAITKQLIELHGGSIRVESILGKGTTFFFTLLKSKKNAEKTPTSSTIMNSIVFEDPDEIVKENSYSSKDDTAKNSLFKILIVDDDPINVKMIINYLSLENYSCIGAESGQEALELIQKYGNPNLILLDVMMPKMSGFDVCQILRKKYTANELPIILLTAKNLITDFVQGFSVGANDYITKPFSKYELLARISSQLQLSQNHNSLLQTKILEGKLQQANKMEALGLLAGGIAHDFNNLLTAIMNSSQLLLSPKRNLDDKSKRYVDLIIQTSSRAADLTTKLLTFGGNRVFNKSNIDLNKLLEDVISILSRSLDKRIKISIHNESDFNIVNGDFSALQNIFINLGINSSHAMSDCGNIEITVQNTVLDKGYCQNSLFELEEGEYCRITIKDDGIGIPEGIIDKIFDPFFTTKQKGKGTGLGLASAYTTITEHHGSISVYSKEKSGTMFTILLPCAESRTVEKKTYHKAVIGSGNILVVDDEELIRITVNDMLKELGYNVITAKDGHEAINIFSSKHSEIDLVLMDMVMPNVNGRDAFFKMKEIDDNSRIIISSGFTDNINCTDLKGFGLSGYLAKPYRIDELSKLIYDVIHEK
ncbi:MAG: ATP-binding protein [Spirochaetaceae bacterium]